MDKHAKKIYRAYLDGKAVQLRPGGSSNFADGAHDWEDMDPFSSVYPPYVHPNLWRIKPNTETHYYRVYLNSTTNRASLYLPPDYIMREHYLGAELQFEKKEYFGGWLSWTESYEVEAGK